MYILLVFHIFLTLVLIGVILLQRGEDANAGSGSGGGLPGSRSGRNALTRATGILASIFFANCIIMAILVRENSKIGPTEGSGSAETLKKDQKVDVDGQNSVAIPAKPMPIKAAGAEQPEKGKIEVNGSDHGSGKDDARLIKSEKPINSAPLGKESANSTKKHSGKKKRGSAAKKKTG